MSFEADRPILTRRRAITCILLNLLATPGLGSLLARRVFEGIGQLILSVGGFAILMVWFVMEMIQYYGQITGDVKVRPIGWIGLVGVVLFAVAWVWSLVTSLSLSKEASAASVRKLQSFMAGNSKLDETKIQSMLAALPNWQRNGDVVTRTFQFKDFPEAMKFVNAVAEIAEREWHHPDIDIRWNKVTLALTTHDAGGLTEKDFALARQCDLLAR